MWKAINAILNFKVDQTMDRDRVHEVVLCDEFFGDVAQFDAEILGAVQKCLEVKNLISKVTNLASLRERKLLSRSLMRSREAVLVPMLPG